MTGKVLVKKPTKIICEIFGVHNLYRNVIATLLRFMQNCPEKLIWTSEMKKISMSQGYLSLMVQTISVRLDGLVEAFVARGDLSCCSR